MNKIKKSLALLLALLMLMTALSLTAVPAFADGSAEPHTFSTEWTVNSRGHWHMCTDDDCNITDYSTCGISGAAYGVHTGLEDDNTCDICGTVFYRPYDVSYTDSTINFNVNVLDSVSEPYKNADCDRFDAFLIADDSGTDFPANMDFDHNGYYDAPHFIIKDSNKYTVNTATATGFCEKNGATYNIILNAANLEGVQYFSAENPYVWLILRPCYSDNGMDYGYNSVNLTYANFYDCCICLGKFDSIDDLQNVKPAKEDDDDDIEILKEETIEDLEAEKEKFVSDDAKKIIDEAIEKINKATDPDDIPVIKAEALEDAEEADEALENAKKEAKEALEEEKKNAIADDAKEILEDAIEDIDNATSLDEVADKKADAEEAAEAAEKELADAKEAAIAEIEEAAGDDCSAALRNVVNNGERAVNKSSTIEAVDEALANALAAIKHQQQVDDFNCPDEYHLLKYKGTVTLLAESKTDKVIYATSDPSVATVDENGKVTAVGKGKCVITASVEGTDISKDVDIEVKYCCCDIILYYILQIFNFMKKIFNSIFAC